MPPSVVGLRDHFRHALGCGVPGLESRVELGPCKAKVLASGSECGSGLQGYRMLGW